MERFHPLWQWLRAHDSELAWIGSASLLTLIASALLVPVLVRRLPDDYFVQRSQNQSLLKKKHPALRWSLLILKNLVGSILLVAGIVMLITPGQGVLTILMGLMLMNFPGKRQLEIRLVRIKPIHLAINWIRKRANLGPLILPENDTPSPQE